jgi:hypothetical protein
MSAIVPTNLLALLPPITSPTVSAKSLALFAGRLLGLLSRDGSTSSFHLKLVLRSSMRALMSTFSALSFMGGRDCWSPSEPWHIKTLSLYASKDLGILCLVVTISVSSGPSPAVRIYGA